MPHCSEGQDAGGGAVTHRSAAVIRMLWLPGGCIALIQKELDTASRDLRVVGVEVLLELVTGARGDFVNTWTSTFLAG